MTEPLIWNWSSGEDAFLLRIGEVEALDDLTPNGALDLRYRLLQGHERGNFANAPVRIREVINCVRLGLIGAGMDRATAERKAKQAYDESDIAALNLLAFTILSRAFQGKDHDPAEKAEGEGEMSASSSPESTATEPPLDGRRNKSKE